MEARRKAQPIHELFFTALLLGTVTVGIFMSRNGGGFHSLNNLWGSALLFGCFTAGITCICSQMGRNSPGKTALFTSALTLVNFLLTFLHHPSMSILEDGKLLQEKGLAALMLTVCSYLAVLWYQRSNRSTT